MASNAIHVGSIVLQSLYTRILGKLEDLSRSLEDDIVTGVLAYGCFEPDMPDIYCGVLCKLKLTGKVKGGILKHTTCTRREMRRI